MKIIVKKQMSNAEFTFEFDKPELKEAIYDASLFANTPSLCDNCGNDAKDGFSLQSNKDGEGNLYVNTVCNQCDAKAKLGTHKSGKSYFWHKFQKYTPKGE
jgi:hypothetical protein